jgi:hypothetical protein
MDTSVWLDLSFEQTSNLIEYMAINNTHNEKKSTIDPTNIAFASRTKNGKKEVHILMCIQLLASKFFN